ncbi:hypothetical protein [Pseudomonas syringae]|uniref:hypothetical protein n=1 Tax=Pseudomonas syringae TaxID=317 RepID=UPI000A98FBCE|nr:hypothetical protein [Pseudomonas syringae]
MELTEKQILEQRYFEQFVQHYPVPAGSVEYSDKPDVLIKNGERKLGIEITHLYKLDGRDNTSEQKQSAIRREVIALAEQLYLSSGERKLEMSFDFDPNIPIKRKNIKKAAKSLATIAKEISSERAGHSSYKAFESMPELRFLYHDGKEYAGSNWRFQQGFDVPTLAITRVKFLVAQKIEKLKSYQKCDIYWLLLIVEFWDPSQDQDISWPEGERIGPTPFERILIYKPAFEQVTEVI